MKLIRLTILFLVIIAVSSCGYKFNGASTGGLKTVNVQLFENNAPRVVPQLSNLLTEALKNRISTQSKLSVTTNDADVAFTGTITDYDIKPIAIQDNQNPVAGANRLTITVMVKYVNNTEFKESKSFDESFTAFTDFTLAGQTLESQELKLIKDINAKLTENIFNRAFAQW